MLESSSNQDEELNSSLQNVATTKLLKKNQSEEELSSDSPTNVPQRDILDNDTELIDEVTIQDTLQNSNTIAAMETTTEIGAIDVTKPQNSASNECINVMEDQLLINTKQQTMREEIYLDPQPSTSKSNADIQPNASNISLKSSVTNPEPPSNKEINPDFSHHQDEYPDSQPTKSMNHIIGPESIISKKRVNIYAPDHGPQMYQARGKLVTRPIITKKLPQVFQYLPVHGKPGPNTSLPEYYRNKVREYVGCDLNDEEFDDLENYCSPEHLKTGLEIKMQTSVPVMGLLNANILHNKFIQPKQSDTPPNLVTVKKNKVRLEKDTKGLLTKKLKYRGVRVLPFSQEENPDYDQQDSLVPAEQDEDLDPGTDILYRVRIYRPYTYSLAKDRFTRCRHSVFCCDTLLTGRHRLTALRDRFVCHNDFDMRIDVSNNPEVLPTTKAKEVFPSGFLFINNVFYVDTREGCIDYSAPIRDWAVKRHIGDFPKMDMCQVRLEDLVLKLGYPEVYVHQGNCEHVFIFSEVRLLNANDPLKFSNYPCSTAIAQNQTVYCTTCAEFSAKWIVVGSDRVPFDPGFFCDKCFKLYMYMDGKKIGNFKAYRYRGNALNVLKPQ